jgi:hypothetical protein
MISSVINQPVVAIAELNVLAKIRKYKFFYEGQHFISMPWRCMAYLSVI